MESRVKAIQNATPRFVEEFESLQMDLKLGQIPHPDRLRTVADEMDLVIDQWEGLLTRLRVTPDFQTREYAKLTEVHLAAHGVSPQSIASMMRWQSNCMRAMADGMPPPMPPPDLDLQSMMEQAQQEAISSDKKNSKTPSISAMQAAEQITADPFDPHVFESEMIAEEYKKLVLDHSNLIENGAKYAEFDPLGKLSYLDHIERIEERWESFFFRFKLMNAVNEEYTKQCEQFLASMKLTEDEYRELLRESHRMMRQDAERERARIL
jgi:hypothetical protein